MHTCMDPVMLEYIPWNMHMVILCFVLLWLYSLLFRVRVIYLTIFFRVASLALGPSASEATLKDMGKYITWIHQNILHNHNRQDHVTKLNAYFMACIVCVRRVIPGKIMASCHQSGAKSLSKSSLIYHQPHSTSNIQWRLSDLLSFK